MAASLYDMPVLVMGMHRSGTSALARVLMLLHGDEPTQVLEANSANPSGFWESPEINAVNQGLLTDRGTNWHSVSPLDGHVAMPGDIDLIRRSVASQFPHARRPVIKDPRICRLVPLWIEALRDEARDFAFPFIVRNPSEVAISLNRRNNFPHALGLNLWLRYYLDAERATRDRNRGLIRYDALLADWRSALRSLREQLQIDIDLDAGGHAVDAFLTPDLHHAKASVEQVNAQFSKYPMAAELWDIMNQWCVRGDLRAGDRQRIDRLREDFDCVADPLDDLLEQQRILEKHRLQDKRAEQAKLFGSDVMKAEIAGLRQDQENGLHDLETRLKKGLKAVLADIDAARRSDAQVEDMRQLAEREREALRQDHAREVAALARTVESAVALSHDLRARTDRISEAHDMAVREAETSATRLARLAAELRALAGDAPRDEPGPVVGNANEADAADRALAALKHAIALAAHERETAARGREAKLQAELEEHRRNLTEATCERDDALRKLEEARSSLLGLRGEYDALGELRDALSEDLEVQGRERDLAREAGEAARAELKSVTRKYRTTQATLARTKAGLDHARQRLSSLKEQAERTERDLQLARSTWAYRFVQALATTWASVLGHLGFLDGSARRSRRDVAAMLESSGLFDGAWYLGRYPDVADSGMEPLQHFLGFGWKELRDPGPDFSASRYLRENPDVVHAGLNPVLHYIEYGQIEGRSTHQSKLKQQPAENLPQFGPAAPVLPPPDPSARYDVPALPSGTCGADEAADPAAPVLGTFAELVDACPGRAAADDEGARDEEVGGQAAAAFARFLQLSGVVPFDPEAWNTGAHDASDALADAWYVSDRVLRLRMRSEGGNAGLGMAGMGDGGHIVCSQYDPENREVVIVKAAADVGLLDIVLRSPCHPLLIAGCSSLGRVCDAFVIGFPSLLRGGIHHADFLGEIARPAGSEVNDPVGYSAALAARLASIRSGDAKPVVARLAVDVHDAKGTGPLFAPWVRAWLRDVFDLPIEAAASAERTDGLAGGGAQHLSAIVAQAGTERSTGGTLVVHGDALPSIAILCATVGPQSVGQAMAQGGGHAVFPLSEAFVQSDSSQPSFAFILPPVPLLAAGGPTLSPSGPQTRLSGGQLPRHPLPPASVTVERGIALHDAELLFPVAAAQALTTAQPAGVRLIVPLDGTGRGDLARTLNALAMQDCAEVVGVTFLGEADRSTLDHAAALFGGGADAVDTWHAATAKRQEPYCGVLMPGIVLHDGRSLRVLCDMVASGAASASCPLVSSSRLGKGWTVKVVANGLVSEIPRGTYMEGQMARSATLWRRIYPIREPIAGFWLAATEKFARWVGADIHQLCREDAEHWCNAFISASLMTDEAPLSGFDAPIADPACFTAVRVLNG